MKFFLPILLLLATLIAPSFAASSVGLDLYINEEFAIQNGTVVKTEFATSLQSGFWVEGHLAENVTLSAQYAILYSGSPLITPITASASLHAGYNSTTLFTYHCDADGVFTFQLRVTVDNTSQLFNITQTCAKPLVNVGTINPATGNLEANIYSNGTFLSNAYLSPLNPNVTVYIWLTPTAQVPEFLSLSSAISTGPQTSESSSVVSSEWKALSKDVLPVSSVSVSFNCIFAEDVISSFTASFDIGQKDPLSFTIEALCPKNQFARAAKLNMNVNDIPILEDGSVTSQFKFDDYNSSLAVVYTSFDNATEVVFHPYFTEENTKYSPFYIGTSYIVGPSPSDVIILELEDGTRVSNYSAFQFTDLFTFTLVADGSYYNGSAFEDVVFLLQCNRTFFDSLRVDGDKKVETVFFGVDLDLVFGSVVERSSSFVGCGKVQEAPSKSDHTLAYALGFGLGGAAVLAFCFFCYKKRSSSYERNEGTYLLHNQH